MKISGRKPVGGAAPAGGLARTTPREKVEAGAPPEQATDVALSASSREVDRARELLAAIPEVRIDRIGEIKPLVDDGSYQVPSRVLAKRMVDSSLKESVRGLKGRGKPGA